MTSIFEKMKMRVGDSQLEAVVFPSQLGINLYLEKSTQVSLCCFLKDFGQKESGMDR